MQFIRDIYLLDLITSSLTARHNFTAKFSWNRIIDHVQKFDKSYKFENAQTLLELSLLTSTEIPLAPPLILEHTSLQYNTCPQLLVANVIPKSPMNIPAVLGHILYDKRISVLYIVFIGTVNGCMAMMDLDYSQTTIDELRNATPDIKCHRGFYHAYTSIRSLLVASVKRYLLQDPLLQIVITGHSLGGALSQLCAYDLAYYQPIHYSFATPMIFNPTGAYIFDKFIVHSYRIANLSDLVIMAPLAVMPNGETFCHVGQLIYFQDNLGDFSLNHTFSYMLNYELDYQVYEIAKDDTII